MWIEHFGGSRLWKFPVLKLYLFLLCSLFSVTLGNTRISYFSNFMFWSIFNKKHQEHGLGFWLWVDHLETWLPFQTAKSWLYKVLSNIQLDTIESNIAISIFLYLWSEGALSVASGGGVSIIEVKELHCSCWHEIASPEPGPDDHVIQWQILTKATQALPEEWPCLFLRRKKARWWWWLPIGGGWYD